MNKNLAAFSILGASLLVAGYMLGPEPFRILIAPEPSPDVLAEPVPQEPKDATLLFVGDIMLSRMVELVTRAAGDYRHPFLLLADTLRAADLVFGNLESPISARGAKAGSIYSFRASPYMMEGISFAGFDALSFANNHVWDYGRDAFLDTLEFLGEKNISPVGAGKDYAEAHAPKVLEAGDARVAFLAYTSLLPESLGKPESVPAVAFPDPQKVKDDIARAKAQADIVVVSFHWGDEYQTKHNADQEARAHEVIDAGADLVVGHHPHVVQELEQYKNGYIAYSLGNFVFDQKFSEETMKGAMLKVTLKEKTITGAELLPIRINDSLQPDID